MTWSAWLYCIVQKHEKKLLFNYQQSASLTIALWLQMKKGGSGCKLDMFKSWA